MYTYTDISSMICCCISTARVPVCKAFLEYVLAHQPTKVGEAKWYKGICLLVCMTAKQLLKVGDAICKVWWPNFLAPVASMIALRRLSAKKKVGEVRHLLHEILDRAKSMQVVFGG